ncbi:MAG: exodeoxyribonuclease VII small subunit [Wolinella sp.]
MKKFETRIDDAKAVLARLSEPNISLEESLELYAKGMENLKEAQKMLEEARLVYEEIQSKNSEENQK